MFKILWFNHTDSVSYKSKTRGEKRNTYGYQHAGVGLVAGRILILLHDFRDVLQSRGGCIWEVGDGS